MSNELTKEKRVKLEKILEDIYWELDAQQRQLAVGSTFDFTDVDNKLITFVEQLIAQAEQKAVLQFDQDIRSVLNLLDGSVEKVKIANYIREYIVPELRKLQDLEGGK